MHIIEKYSNRIGMLSVGKVVKMPACVKECERNGGSEAKYVILIDDSLSSTNISFL